MNASSGRDLVKLPSIILLAALACCLAGAAPSSLSPRRLDPPAAPGAMAPNLALDGDDVLLTWLEPLPSRGAEKVHRLRFARLSGGRWSAPSTVSQGPGFFANWADVPAVVAGPRGELLAHWLAKSGPGTYAYGVELARSTDGGRSWRRLGLLHEPDSETEHGFVTFVPERDGVRAFWLDGRETAKGGAMALRTALVGASAGRSELLDPRICDCCQTDAAMTGQGPLVVYRDRSEGEVRDILAIRRAGAGWSRPAVVHADGWKIPGCPVNGPAVAAMGRRAAVAWFTGAPPAGARVQLALSQDAGASFGPPLLIDGERPLGRVDVALDAAGGAVVSWLALDGENAAVRLRRASSAGAVGAAMTVAGTGAARSSGFPRLARLGDRLVVTWLEDGEPSRLRTSLLPLAAVPAPPAR